MNIARLFRPRARLVEYLIDVNELAYCVETRPWGCPVWRQSLKWFFYRNESELVQLLKTAGYKVQKKKRAFL